MPFDDSWLQDRWTHEDASRFRGHIGIDRGVDERTTAVAVVLQDLLAQRGWVSPQVTIERGFLESYVHIRVVAQATLHCRASISDEALAASRNQHSLLELENTLRQVVNAFPDISEESQKRRSEELQELRELRRLRELALQQNWPGAQSIVNKAPSDPWFLVPTPTPSRWDRIVKGDLLAEDD